MDLLEQYGTDPQLEADGVWSDSFKGGVEMKIRSSQSAEVKAAQARVNKRNERYWKINEEIPEPLKNKNLTELASAAVADWQCRVRAAGKPDQVSSSIAFAGQSLDCTKEHKEFVFSDPRLWSLRATVIAQSNDIALFREQAIADDAGNSPVSSAPASSSADTDNA